MWMQNGQWYPVSWKVVPNVLVVKQRGKCLNFSEIKKQTGISLTQRMKNKQRKKKLS